MKPVVKSVPRSWVRITKKTAFLGQLFTNGWKSPLTTNHRIDSGSVVQTVSTPWSASWPLTRKKLGQWMTEEHPRVSSPKIAPLVRDKEPSEIRSRVGHVAARERCWWCSPPFSVRAVKVPGKLSRTVSGLQRITASFASELAGAGRSFTFFKFRPRSRLTNQVSSQPKT